MRFWTRIEQIFKRNVLHLLEHFWGRKVLTPDEFERKTIHKILVIRQHDQLGDFLLSTPVLRAIRLHWPDAFVALLVRGYTEPVARYNRYVDDILILHEVGYHWTWKRIKKLWRQLHRGYDLVVVINSVSHSLSTDLLSWLCHARYVLGPSHRRFPGTSRNFFYNLIAPYGDDHRHQSEKNMDILRYIGVKAKNLYSHITILEAEKERARAQLEELGFDPAKPIIGIHPGAGKRNNRWPVARFIQVARICRQELNLQPLLFYGPDEFDLRDQFLKQMPIPKYYDPDLRRLAAMFACLSLFIGNDTGTTHMVAAVGTPLVVIFGPTSAREWKPWGKEFIALQGKQGDCTSISVQEVINSIKQLIPLVEGRIPNWKPSHDLSPG